MFGCSTSQTPAVTAKTCQNTRRTKNHMRIERVASATIECKIYVNIFSASYHVDVAGCSSVLFGLEIHLIWPQRSELPVYFVRRANGFCCSTTIFKLKVCVMKFCLCNSRWSPQQMQYAVCVLPAFGSVHWWHRLSLNWSAFRARSPYSKRYANAMDMKTPFGFRNSAISYYVHIIADAITLCICSAEYSNGSRTFSLSKWLECSECPLALQCLPLWMKIWKFLSGSVDSFMH